MVFVSILGYGDTLISLQLLKQAFPEHSNLRIAGTSLTAEVQEAIPELRFELETVLPGHAAFFRFREAGPHMSLTEIRAFRAWARKRLSADDIVLFEKRDLRNHLIVGGCGARICEPRRNRSIYEDRKEMLEKVSRRTIDLAPGASRRSPESTVLINPSARMRHKEPPPEATTRFLAFLKERGIKITLVDPDGRYAAGRPLVHQYYGRPLLTDAISLLREHDLYIGPDSFFIHLAYYFRVPAITLVPDRGYDFYFAPPGAREAGRTLSFAECADASRLRQAFPA